MSLIWETSSDKKSMTQSGVFEAISGFYAAEKEQDLFRAATWLRHLEFLKHMQRLNQTSIADSETCERGGRRRG